MDDLIAAPSRAPWEHLFFDLRYAARHLLGAPVFTMSAIAILAISLGANTTVFSLTYSLFFRDLPVPRADRLVQLTLHSASQDVVFMPAETYSAIAEDQRVFSSVCGWRSNQLIETGSLEPRTVPVAIIREDCTATLGLRPAMGRLFEQGDRLPGPEGIAAVLSYKYWRGHFDGDAGILGRKLLLQDIAARPLLTVIVGVLPPSFKGLVVGEEPSVLLPYQLHTGRMSKGFIEANEDGALMFARLLPHIDQHRATAQVDTAFQNRVAHGRQESLGKAGVASGQDGDVHVAVTSARSGYSSLRAEYERPLIVLHVLAGLILMSGSAYLATLLFVQSISRRREMAIRSALGAGRSYIIRQFLAESMILVSAGAGLALVWTFLATPLTLNFVRNYRESTVLDLAPNAPVFSFVGVIYIACVLFFALLPSWRSRNLNIADEIKESNRSLLAGKGRTRYGYWLIPVQIAVSMLLVTMASLLSLTVLHLLGQNKGYRAQDIIFLQLDFPFITGANWEQSSKVAARIGVYQNILERLNGTPGLQSASVDLTHPLAGAIYFSEFRATASGTDDDNSQILLNTVGPKYFETVGTSLLVGRDFAASDTVNSQPVCILSQSAIHLFFPQGTSVGAVLFQPLGGQKVKALQVIGVVQDTRFQGLRNDTTPMIYLDYAQMKDAGAMEFVLKAHDQALSAYAVRAVLDELSIRQHITKVVTMQHELDRSVGRERVTAMVSSFFAIIVVLLSAVGLFGFLSYSVVCRRAEISIRMALGATRAGILWIVARQALALLTPGLLLGVILSAIGSRLLGSLIYGTTMLNPIVLGINMAALVIVTGSAVSIPAIRAASLKPLDALRAQ